MTGARSRHASLSFIRPDVLSPPPAVALRRCRSGCKVDRRTTCLLVHAVDSVRLECVRVSDGCRNDVDKALLYPADAASDVDTASNSGLTRYRHTAALFTIKCYQYCFTHVTNVY